MQNNSFEIRELEVYDWLKFTSFWDLKPSWQNSITAVEKLKKFNISIGLYENEKLVGYTIFNPKTKRIHQLSVDKNYRKRGIGRQLLEYISSNYGRDISIINVDNASKDTLKFMTDIEMKTFIKQYEMELTLK
jgi:ribosomal protein S18 acetylase RimI-like enzyme